MQWRDREREVDPSFPTTTWDWHGLRLRGWTMIGFRLKLLAGFGAVLAVVLAIGGFAFWLVRDYSAVFDRIFRENYDSIRYGQQMKEALGEMDRAVWAWSSGDSTAGEAWKASRRKYLDNFRQGNGNVTLEGEARALGILDSLWVRHDSALGALFAAKPTDPAREAMLVHQRRSLEISQAAQAIIDLNVGGIFSVDGRVRRGAAKVQRTLLILLGAGVFLAIALSSLVATWIASPVRSLTASVREVGKGNLDLVVAIPSRDELGELAEAFNTMAAQLRVFRKSDRQRLWRIHRTTQNAIDSMPDAVAVVAPDGRVEMSNDAARRLFGLETNALLDSSSEGLLVPFFKAAVETRQAVQPKGFEAALQAFDGGERFFLPRAIPILDPDGAMAGVTLVLADITQLRRLDELKSGALSVVAHELRTPLTSLRMASHLLLDDRVGDLSTRQEGLAEGMRDDADRLWRIVEELLDIGRMDAGRDALERSAIDLTEIVKHGMGAREGAYREKGVKLVLEAGSPIPPLHGDGPRLSVALDNLLSNALRHTPSGGVVVVRLGSEGDQATLEVLDNGPGIPSEHLQRLFERFYRVPGQSPATGVGLGLSIVREIVSGHGGSIVATSLPGEGARFEIRLPLAARRQVEKPQEVPRA